MKMPLQKLPPNGPLSVSVLANERPQLQNRRRTLQTISELSTTEKNPPDFVSSIGNENIRRVTHDNTPGVGRSTPKPAKRKSLPQYHSSPKVYPLQPSITVTPAHEQESQPSRASKGSRPVPITTDEVAGWNAKRERARMRTMTEAKALRYTPGEEVEAPMIAIRPSTRSQPTSLKHPSNVQTQLKGSGSCSCLSGQVERRASLGSTTNNASPYDVRPEASERASTDSSSYQSRDSFINRTRSGSSNTSYTSQDAPPLPNSVAPNMKGYCAELTIHNQNLVSFGESARSKNLNPSRSSRTLSLPSDSFMHTSTSRHRYATAQDLRQPSTQQPRQISAQRARNQALAALTAVNSHSRANQRAQHQTSPHGSLHRSRHTSLTSHPTNSFSYQKTASPRRNSLHYHAQLEVQRRVTLPSSVYFKNDIKCTSPHRGPNSRHVSFEQRTVPKRESLTQWKKEREEAKASSHTDHKAWMQERVRRANELENEREKELVAMGKRTGRNSSRSCFGGLFALIGGKNG